MRPITRTLKTDHLHKVPYSSDRRRCSADRLSSMGTQPERTTSVAATFNAAAPTYDAPSQDFFRVLAAEVIRRVVPEPDATVLDVPCGTGHAIGELLRVLGPDGRVTGIDISPAMAEIAAAKVEREGSGRATVSVGDFRSLPIDDGSVDLALCVFGIFFVPDMAAGLAELWRVVAPGGRLIVVTWAPGLFDPLRLVFYGTAHELRPDLVPEAPGAKITPTATEDGMAALVSAAGIDVTPSFTPIPHTHPLADRSTWWEIVMGAGWRSVVDAMTPDEARQLREACDAAVAAGPVTSVRCDALMTVIARPALER